MAKESSWHYNVELVRELNQQFEQAPILIGGCGRSGTSLLLSILSAHLDIHACNRELGLFKPAKLLGLKKGKARLHRLHDYLIENPVPEHAKRWCEKTPKNIRVLPLIDNLFGGRFKFIHIVRDGRDVILSKHPKKPSEYYVDPSRWTRDVSLGLAYQDHPCVYTIRYEDLILNFEPTITGLCRFLDLEISEQILNWHKYAQVRKSDAYVAEIKSIFSSSIGKWQDQANKNRADQLMKRPKARKLLQHFGYL